jgi:putative transposase
VDTLGLILLARVHPANIQDRDGARMVLTHLEERFGWLKLIWADGGYAGVLQDWVRGLARHRRVDLQIVKRNEDVKGFKVLPKRWIVERTFGWLTQSRRLNKDYETSIESAEAFIYIAMTRLMLRRNP